MTTDATQAGSGELVVDASGDVWLVAEDIDGDGTDDDVYVLFDEETGDKYVWYDAVIEEFCDNGDDANATVLMVYDYEEDSWTLLWDSDCAEDENLIYGCSLDAAGEPDECDVCEVDGSGDLACLSDAEGPDAGVPADEPAWDCACDADCDGDAYEIATEEPICIDTTEEAAEAAVAECLAAFEVDECEELTCDCVCEEAADFVCQ